MAEVQWLAEHLAIADCLHRFPNELSGGQQQRAAIARAILHKPAILLADEPTGNLDSDRAAEVMHILSDLNRQGTTILMVTHNESLTRYCQRSFFISDGRMVNG